MFMSLSLRNQGTSTRHKSSASTRSTATMLPPYNESFTPEWWMGTPEEVTPPSEGQTTNAESATGLKGSGGSSSAAEGSAPPPQYRPPSISGVLPPRYPSMSKPRSPSIESSTSSSSSLSYVDPDSPPTTGDSALPTVVESQGLSPYSEDAYRNFVGTKKAGLKMKALGSFKLGSNKPNLSATPEVEILTAAESQMYSSEKLDNFRWLSTLAGRYADCPPLTEKDAVDANITKKISDIGKFAELAYSSIFIESLINHNKLLEKGQVLSDYLSLLSDCVPVRQISGPKTDLVAFVVYRRTTKQLVVSICGSSKVKHTVQNLRATRTPWPTPPANDGKEPGVVPIEVVAPLTPKDMPAAHSGFLALFRDVKRELEEAVLAGVSTHCVDELVLTGHSMGGCIAYLLCMDLLSPNALIPLPKKMCLTTFGMPRAGNAPLVQHFKSLVTKWNGAFEEFSIKGYNDGVPAVPLRSMGYAHLCERPMYTFRKQLYWVPAGHYESSLFCVQHHQPQSGDEIDDTQNTFPRGGHNYYNGRDLEALRRVSDKLLVAGFPDMLDRDWENEVKAVSGKAGKTKKKK